METNEMKLADSYKSFVDKIFEIYHMANYGLGQGTTLWKVRGVFAKEENAVRMHKAYIVLSSLMDNQYLTYATYDPSLVVLTQKGVDYILGKSPLELSVDLNKYVDIDNVSADESFNRLWELIGNSHSSLFYLDEESIYSVIHSYSSSLPQHFKTYLIENAIEHKSLRDIFEALAQEIDVAMRKELLSTLSSLIEEKYSISKLKNQYVEWTELKPVEAC